MTLAQLLVVQAHDTAIDQLIHRRETLPEIELIADLGRQRAQLEERRTGLDEQSHTLGRTQKKLEDEVALVEERHGRETARLYSGTVNAVKELEAIQYELESLEGRRRALEDQVLDVMESSEPVDNQIAELDSQLAELAARQDQAAATLMAAQAEIDTGIAAERAQRAAAAGAIEPGLLAEYERARAQCGGVGASRLIDKTCEGCHLQLSAVDIDRIRKLPAGEIAWCDCGRILVRS